MNSTITFETIERANALFWQQMLAMEMVPVRFETLEDDSAAIASRCIGEHHFVGSCTLSGTWCGKIEVRLSEGLARHAASTMLMQPPEEVLASDTLDATREIANMIAGTIKSALPRPCSMTIPEAGFEAINFCIACETTDSLTVFFQHPEGDFMVRVSEHLSAACKNAANIPA